MSKTAFDKSSLLLCKHHRQIDHSEEAEIVPKTKKASSTVAEFDVYSSTSKTTLYIAQQKHGHWIELVACNIAITVHLINSLNLNTNSLNSETSTDFISDNDNIRK